MDVNCVLLYLARRTALYCDKQSASKHERPCAEAQGRLSPGRASGRYQCSTHCVTAAKDRHRHRRWIHEKGVTASRLETSDPSMRPSEASSTFLQFRPSPTMADLFVGMVVGWHR